MKLYHGTSSTHLGAILEGGIRPRGKANGNWEHTVPSNARAVYLTDAYPIHFAGAAAKDGAHLVAIEVDTTMLDPDRFAPDEDCLEQGTRADPRYQDVPGTRPFNIKRRTMWFRKRALSNFAHWWPRSLETMGTCCYYGHIEPYAITAYVTWPQQHPVNSYSVSDPTITPLNYLIKGPYYRQLTRAMFGYPVDPVDLHERELAVLTNPKLVAGIVRMGGGS